MEKDPQVKELVKIRFKKLKNGNTSIYLDLYLNGVREYEFLNIYLRPEESRADKLWNKEQLRGWPMQSRRSASLASRTENSASRISSEQGS